MLGQFPVSGKAISVQGTVPTTNVYAQALSATQSSSALAWSKLANKVMSATSVTNTIFGNTTANFPTLGINNTAIGGANSWASPTSIYVSDSVCATSTITSGSTNYLVATGFGFSVPSNVIILGVVVVWNRTGASISTAIGDVFNCKLWNGSDTTIDDSIGTITNTYNPTGGASGSLGSSSSTWGATLTPSIVNSSTFGCAFWNTSTGGVAQMGLDYCTMQVWYAYPPFPTLNKFVNKTYSATQSSVAAPLITNGDTGAKYFTSTVQQQTSGTLATWVNPDNARVNDGSSATLTDASTGSHDIIFKLSDLVTIPSTATITGIQLNVTGQTSNTSDGLGCQFGNNTLTTTAYYGISPGTVGFDCYYTSTGTTQTLTWGGSSNTWSLLSAQLIGSWWNGANSSINIWSTGITGATMSIDYVTIEVWYTTSTPGNIIKSVGKNESATQTSVPSFVKSSMKTLSTVSNSVVTWLASKLSSTTTYYQTMMATQGQTATFIKAISNLSAMSVVQASTSSLSKLTSKYWSTNSTSVSTVVKQSGKVLTSSSTSIPSIVKQSGKVLTSSSTSVPSIKKQVNKGWSVSSTSVSLWIKSIAKTWSVSSTSAPNFIKSTNKILSAVSTSAPTFLRSILHFVLWSTTQGSTSTWSKSIAKPWSISSTSVPSIVKRYSHTWSVSSTSVPSFVKQVNKIWSVSSTTVATFLKGAVHYVIMSATQGQTAQWIKMTGKNWSLSSTSVPSIKKQVNKGLSVSSTSVSSLFKQFNHTWSLSSTSVPSLVKSANKPWAVSSTSVPKLVKQINKGWSVSSVSIPSMVKSIFKPLSIVSTSIPTFTKQVNKIWSVVSTSIPTFLKGSLHYVIMSATQSSTAKWIKSAGKSLTSISTSVPSVSKSVQKGLSTSSTSVPSLNKGMFKLWGTTQASISSFVKQTKKSLFGSITSVANLNKYTNKALTINSTTVGSFNKGFFKTWSTTQGSISTMDTLRQAFVRPFNLLSTTLNDWKQYALTIYQSYYQFIVDKKVFEAEAKATTETIPYQWVFLKAQPYSATVLVRLLNGTDINPSAILQGSPIIGTNSVTQVITGGNEGCIYNLITTIRMKDGTVKVLETYLPVSTI